MIRYLAACIPAFPIFAIDLEFTLALYSPIFSALRLSRKQQWTFRIIDLKVARDLEKRLSRFGA
jgi:hypothetical protein